MLSHLAEVSQRARGRSQSWARSPGRFARSWCTARLRSAASQGRRRDALKVTQLVYGKAGLYLGVSNS